MKSMPSRKKSCRQCSDAKTRCDLVRPSCSRCTSRGHRCEYFTNPAESTLAAVNGHLSLNSPTYISSFPMAVPSGSASDSSAQPLSWSAESRDVRVPSSPSSSSVTGESKRSDVGASASSMTRIPMEGTHEASASLSFAHVELASSIDSARIKERWIDGFIPSKTLCPKSMPPQTLLFIARILKGYPRKMLRPKELPPIVHPLQITTSHGPSSLANCISIVRMWYDRAPGSEGIVSRTVTTEMERLLQEYTALDEMDLLSAFQCYLVYALMTFQSNDPRLPVADRTTVVNLEEIASRLGDRGLVCKAEVEHTRPDWESWIVAEAKRRSVFAMYMFQNLFNAVNDIPVYLAEELASLPAPASKILWEAKNRDVWEREYDKFLASWENGGLKLGELWPHKFTGDPMVREDRVDRWSEAVDEFGMMLLSICIHTHGN
ncbi:hypothetical protein HGRIS_002716 [Hohenbuehelia grisea]|uniref:Zn(2)-C6 fungal-type domain-containing protein n=1 Tax=Hohenbuehelia grisea TaxID=104357 RepID=A0ABR3JMH8_9AGAR